MLEIFDYGESQHQLYSKIQNVLNGNNSPASQCIKTMVTLYQTMSGSLSPENRSIMFQKLVNVNRRINLNERIAALTDSPIVKQIFDILCSYDYTQTQKIMFEVCSLKVLQDDYYIKDSIYQLRAVATILCSHIVFENGNIKLMSGKEELGVITKEMDEITIDNRKFVLLEDAHSGGEQIVEKSSAFVEEVSNEIFSNVEDSSFGKCEKLLINILPHVRQAYPDAFYHVDDSHGIIAVDIYRDCFILRRLFSFFEECLRGGYVGALFHDSSERFSRTLKDYLSFYNSTRAKPFPFKFFSLDGVNFPQVFGNDRVINVQNTMNEPSGGWGCVGDVRDFRAMSSQHLQKIETDLNNSDVLASVARDETLLVVFHEQYPFSGYKLVRDSFERDIYYSSWLLEWNCSVYFTSPHRMRNFVVYSGNDHYHGDVQYFRDENSLISNVQLTKCILDRLALSAYRNSLIYPNVELVGNIRDVFVERAMNFEENYADIFDTGEDDRSFGHFVATFFEGGFPMLKYERRKDGQRGSIVNADLVNRKVAFMKLKVQEWTVEQLRLSGLSNMEIRYMVSKQIIVPVTHGTIRRYEFSTQRKKVRRFVESDISVNVVTKFKDRIVCSDYYMPVSDVIVVNERYNSFRNMYQNLSNCDRVKPSDGSLTFHEVGLVVKVS